MGSSESKESGARLHNANLARATFPLEFNLYQENLSTSLKLILGEHKNQPTNVVSLPQGWWGDMILYSSSSSRSEPLAVVKNAGRLSKHDAIELASLTPGAPVFREEMKYFLRDWTSGYSFSCPIPNSGNERFEWRSSKGSEIKDMGGSSHGWELVRLDCKDEIVAVWSHTKVSMSKVASFRFVGSGASHQLGPVLMVMAVTTFLRIWQKRMQITMGAAVA